MKLTGQNKWHWNIFICFSRQAQTEARNALLCIERTPTNETNSTRQVALKHIHLVLLPSTDRSRHCKFRKTTETVGHFLDWLHLDVVIKFWKIWTKNTRLITTPNTLDSLNWIHGNQLLAIFSGTTPAHKQGVAAEIRTSKWLAEKNGDHKVSNKSEGPRTTKEQNEKIAKSNNSG